MKLITVQIRLFRNILDSTVVSIQDDVTCLVGKNESGKTAFLHALYRLNPAYSNVLFSVPDHYPAWLEKRDRLRGVDLERVRPVRAVFAIEHDDLQVLEQRFGSGVLKSDTVVLERDYGGELVYTFDPNEQAAVKHIVTQSELPAAIVSETAELENLDALFDFISNLKTRGEEQPEAVQAATALETKIADTFGKVSLPAKVLLL
jgi:energy-coupling factor transporter ATP-binding protein EcfA2